MSVIVDSPIWFLAFRRKTVSAPEVALLTHLIQQKQAHLIGAVRQEVLSGIQDRDRFEQIKNRLAPYPQLSLSPGHYERAAEFSNLCRANGIQGSSTDFLICAVSELDGLSIFTTDQDFQHFGKVLPIRMYAAQN